MTIKAVNSLGLSNETGAIPSARGVFYLEPNTANLGTVTSVSTSTSSATYTIGTDAFSVSTGFSSVDFDTLTTSAYNDLIALSSGDTITLGSWASDDGNPTSITLDFFDGDSSYLQAYFSSTASNFDYFASTSYGPTDTWSIGGSISTSVATNNSNLALSQTYFEIGNLTPFVSANATVSSGTITVSGDFSSSISAGMNVAEKSYPTGAKLRQYNLESGEYQDAVFAPTSSFVNAIASSTTVSINTNSDYVWGVTLIEFPSDWVEWVVEADYQLDTQASSAGTNAGYARVKWIPDPTSITATNTVTLNESNTYANGVGTFITYNAAQIVGTAVDLATPTTVTGVVGIKSCYSMPVIRHSSMDATKPTSAAIFGFYDPRYSGYVAEGRATVTVRRLK